MKKHWLILVAIIGFIKGASAQIQLAIPIPDTLSGTSLQLTMHEDSVSFFPGAKTHTLAFNQYAYLGPTLMLHKGQQVNMTVSNHINDTTNVHWHGMHVAAVNDGGPHTMIMQDMEWNPSFTVLDRASTYWYHPHFHGKTAKQAIRGAAGMIIVHDVDELALPIPHRYGVDDFPIVVQCAQFDSLNQPMPLGMQDSTLLVNGTRANNGYEAFLPVPAQVIRLRLLNASGERSFLFGFTNNMSFGIIGSDGGLLAAPLNATRIRISPGERYEILIDLSGREGQSLSLMSYASELPVGTQGGPTMEMGEGNPPMDSPLNGIDFNILRLEVQAATNNPIIAFPNALVQVTPIPESQADITRTIAMTADNALVMDGPFYFNGLLYDMERIDYHIPINSTEIWSISNQTMVAHPFHIHMVQFYVLDRDGNPVSQHERGRKDVVMIHPNETVRFIARFETFADTTIPYVYHCHILMHEDAGMMGQFVVVPDPLGIESVSDITESKLYPQPTNDLLRWNLLPNEQQEALEIRSISGQLLLKGSTESFIDVQCLPAGMYVFQLQTSQRTQRTRFIKN